MRRLASAMAATFLFANTATAEIIPLQAISDYFNSFTSAQAKFTQINGDGSRSTGTLSIRRPGRARFEYDPPVGALVLAAGGQVAVFDDKSNTAPEQYPLRRTPLNVILREQVDLDAARMVVGHLEVDDTTRVIAQDPDNPDAGQIELIFTGDPVALRQWIITDETGGRTAVVLDELRTGVELGASLFSIPIEIERRER